MHDHSHAHGHAHGHEHAHGVRDFGPVFALVAAINVVLIVVQVIYGLLAQSMALLADAGHNFGDVLGLFIAWGAFALGRIAPTQRYTYGFRPASILAALLNGMILLVATGAIAWEAFERLSRPAEVAGGTVMAVAAIGIVINGVSAWLLMRGGKGDLNIHGAFLHMAADAAVSVGVVISGAVILWTGWAWVDPAVSLAISVVIVWGAWGLLREAVRGSLGAVPSDIDPQAVGAYLRGLPGVAAIHDLHVWGMSTTERALTCHLVMPAGHPGDAFLQSLSRDLHDRFAIAHPTVQIELGDGDACGLAPDNVV